MLSDITIGNAKTDGKDFRFWFVGRVEAWCRENSVPFDKNRFGLRNTDSIEMKWGTYKKNEVRNVWASCSERMAMSILIRGDFTFAFREVRDHSTYKEVRLKDEGDYVIWREDTEHTWRMDEDSVILTVRWSLK